MTPKSKEARLATGAKMLPTGYGSNYMPYKNPSDQKDWRIANKEKIVAQSKVYYEVNKEEITARNKAWYEKHKEELQTRYQETREKKKAYQEANKEKIAGQRNIYRNQRRKNDPKYRLACNLRGRLSRALKGNFKSGSAVRDLGCSIEFLKVYLEALFQSGMAWDNYGEWHIDHIKPLASFDLTDREQLLIACHYTNLQPLWAEENLRKGDK